MERTRLSIANTGLGIFGICKTNCFLSANEHKSNAKKGKNRGLRRIEARSTASGQEAAAHSHTESLPFCRGTGHVTFEPGLGYSRFSVSASIGENNLIFNERPRNVVENKGQASESRYYLSRDRGDVAFKPGYSRFPVPPSIGEDNLILNERPRNVVENKGQASESRYDPSGDRGHVAFEPGLGYSRLPLPASIRENNLVFNERTGNVVENKGPASESRN